MQFLPHFAAQRGVDLADLGGRNAWMISKGRGVMLAGVLARMFKQIPLQDWLTYCDRHGMPAFLGKTTAQKGTAGWTDMRDAVATMGSEFGAVINQGDMIDVLDLATQGEVPYVKLIDRMDRAQVRLWRGGDLSTMAMQDGVGGNAQQEDSDELDADNSAWVSETINRNLTAQVVAWRFGRNTPVLCELRLRTKTRDNLTAELGIVKAAKALGVRVSKSWFTNKFCIVEADASELALGETSPPTIPPINPILPIPPASTTAANTSSLMAHDPSAHDPMHAIRTALAADMQPLGDALHAAYQTGDLPAMQAALKKISKNLPELAGDATALSQELAAQMVRAWLGESGDTTAANDNNGWDETRVRRQPPGITEGGRFAIREFTAAEQEEIILDVLAASKSNGGYSSGKSLGLVSPKAISLARSAGEDLTCYVKYVEPSRIRHADNSHGEGNERRQNQRPVKPSDVLRLHEVLDDPDAVRRAELDGPDGLHRLFFEKKLDGTTKATVEVRPGKRRLAFISMRIHT